MVRNFNRWQRQMKEENLRGKLRQKRKDGPYYYRLTVATGDRKEFPLKTNIYEEAVQAAFEIDAVYEAPNKEVAFAQINAIKGFSKQMEQLPLDEIWKIYDASPDRAHPGIHEHLMYHSTLDEFIDFAAGKIRFKKRKTMPVQTVDQVSYAVLLDFDAYLKTTNLAVNTHNRKMKRLRKIFSCLKDYYAGDNPFQNKNLFRQIREEQDTVVRRQAFTKEQEEQLRTVLSDSVHKVKNKEEIRVIYYLGMYTGQRLKDCVLLQWQNIDFTHESIWVRQFKTGKNVIIPIAPQLMTVLKEAFERKENQYVCPNVAARYSTKDEHGKNTGNNKVNKDVLRVISWIGLESSVEVEGRNKKMTVYGFHSLRHSFCSFCAEAGVPKAVLLSILGTDSDIADKYYTHVGDEAQRQAIMAISGQKSDSYKDRVQSALHLLKTNPAPTKELLQEIRHILEGQP